MRSLAVVVLVGALLALVAGCSSGVSEKDVESKGKQIDDATEEFLGGPVPDEEQRD